MHDPRAIANYLINLGIDAGNYLTLMQVLKLSYISHGVSLAFLNKPLAIEEPEAWKYGPVFPTVYHALKLNGNDPISEVIKKIGSGFKFIPVEESFSSEEEEAIQFVYNEYAHLDGFELSTLTHKEGTPWYEVWHANPNARSMKIPNKKIKCHFESLFVVNSR